MLRCNIETTLQFPYSTSVLLDELKHENEVLLDQWTKMLAAIAPVPTCGFLLSLDDAKARNAAAKTASAKTTAQASEPQLGGFVEGIHLCIQGSGGNNVVNFLSLDHSVYGKVKNNPGEVVALIKTMLDLEAKGNEVNWRKSNSIYMPGSVGPDQANNTTKSAAFKTLMATNLGERIQREDLNKYAKASGTDWFRNFMLNTAAKKNT
jgi:hypothetical protein